MKIVVSVSRNCFFFRGWGGEGRIVPRVVKKVL